MATNTSATTNGAVPATAASPPSPATSSPTAPSLATTPQTSDVRAGTDNLPAAGTTKADFDNGKELMITVVSAMGEERALAAKEAPKGAS